MDKLAECFRKSAKDQCTIDISHGLSCGCALCTRGPPDCLQHKASWTTIMHVALFSLHSLHDNRQYFSLKSTVYPFFKLHWESLGCKQKNTMKWRKIILDTLCHSPHLFATGFRAIAKAGYWGLRQIVDPWVTPFGSTKARHFVPKNHYEIVLNSDMDLASPQHTSPQHNAQQQQQLLQQQNIQQHIQQQRQLHTSSPLTLASLPVRTHSPSMPPLPVHSTSQRASYRYPVAVQSPLSPLLAPLLEVHINSYQPSPPPPPIPEDFPETYDRAKLPDIDMHDNLTLPPLHPTLHDAEGGPRLASGQSGNSTGSSFPTYILTSDEDVRVSEECYMTNGRKHKAHDKKLPPIRDLFKSVWKKLKM